MKIKDVEISKLKPYANNPRKNEAAVEPVAESIKAFGFKVPVVIDKAGVIVAGHTRLEAAKRLGLDKVPCVVADDLTPEQVKAFRLADNKVSEFAEWDAVKLADELADISDFDMQEFGFDFGKYSGQSLNAGGEVDIDNFSDEKFDCVCPKCGFKFNSKG